MVQVNSGAGPFTWMLWSLPAVTVPDFQKSSGERTEGPEDLGPDDAGGYSGLISAIATASGQIRATSAKRQA